MDKHTAERLIQLLEVLVSRTEECQIKVLAMERALLDKNPETKIQYQRLVRSLKSDPAIQTNASSAEAALQVLRTKLHQS